MNARALCLFVIALSLAACADTAPPPAPSEPVPTVFDDQLKAIDKAEAVEDQMIEQQQAQDEAMRAQGG